jgi:chorismate-pyruvate lyase
LLAQFFCLEGEKGFVVLIRVGTENFTSKTNTVKKEVLLKSKREPVIEAKTKIRKQENKAKHISTRPFSR